MWPSRPRQELLRRINRLPGGTSSIVAMRRALLSRVARQPELQALEADFVHLLSSWFNPGFLQMRRVDWNSPAQLLEQIIHHEAVHRDRRLGRPAPAPAARPPLLRVLPPAAARRAADLRRGGAAAARCRRDRAADRQGVAPLPPTVQGRRVLLDQQLPAGLKGVSLGNFLIKRVAEELQARAAAAARPSARCRRSRLRALAARRRGRDGLPKARPSAWRRRATLLRSAAATSTAGQRRRAARACRGARRRCCAWRALPRLPFAQPGGDPVARFHLDNGARLERLNRSATCRPRG
jgi:malonyl-CoA decarboxylase